MMLFRKSIVLATVSLLGVSACSGESESDSTAVVTSEVAADTTVTAAADTTVTAAADTTVAAAADTTVAAVGAPTGGPGRGVAAESVATVDELVDLIQEAYGDAGLGLHRGHQDVEALLIDVLGITHDEMHVRMETQGQNLAVMADELGVGSQTLIDALVASRTIAVDNLVAAGTLTEDLGQAYREAIVEAYTYRVTWNGSDATPTATAL